MGLYMREKIKISVTNLHTHATFHIEKGLWRKGFICHLVSSETHNTLSTCVTCKPTLKRTTAFKDSFIITVYYTTSH